MGTTAHAPIGLYRRLPVPAALSGGGSGTAHTRYPRCTLNLFTIKIDKNYGNNQNILSPASDDAGRVARRR